MDLFSVEGNLTYQEIIRQQSGWKKAISELKNQKEYLRSLISKFQEYTWVFSGCGTSFYLAQTASVIFEKLTSIPTNVVPASEILIFPDLVYNPSHENVLISFSRSGTTTEIVRAVEKTRNELHLPTIAISCDPKSTMSVESEYRVSFPFERENSVVMTGSFTTMLISLIYVASLKFTDVDYLTQIDTIADDSRRVMNDYEPLIKSVLAENRFTNFVFLGQGPLYGIANEAALKMQEMSISSSQSFHSLEYRHGPMSTATENTLITVLCSRAGESFNLGLVKDLKNLGSKTLVLRSKEDGAALDSADFEVTVPEKYNDFLTPLLFMPVLQLLGYYCAVSKNINPDSPKNLSAVVELNI